MLNRRGEDWRERKLGVELRKVMVDLFFLKRK